MAMWDTITYRLIATFRKTFNVQVPWEKYEYGNDGMLCNSTVHIFVVMKYNTFFHLSYL